METGSHGCLQSKLEEHGPEENSTEDGDLGTFTGSGKEEALTVGEWLKRPGNTAKLILQKPLSPMPLN